MTRDSTKQALLNAAQKLFTEKGYEAVSTRELAEAAGVNLGAIQYHFGSKAKLFVETIHEMMGSGACVKAGAVFQTPPESKEEAAVQVALFIEGFLDNMVRPEGPQPFRLVFREILSQSARDEEMFEILVSSTVENYTRPLVDQLTAVLAVMTPDTPKRDLTRYAGSICGQCSFYMTHLPFIERLNNQKIADPDVFKKTVEHICRVTLKSLDCDDQFIDKVLAKALER